MGGAHEPFGGARVWPDFPGASAVTSGPAGQDPGPEVTALYEAHALSLIRLAYVVIGDPAAAEDVVQDAFLGPVQAGGSRCVTRPGPPAIYASSVVNGCRMVAAVEFAP